MFSGKRISCRTAQKKNPVESWNHASQVEYQIDRIRWLVALACMVVRSAQTASRSRQVSKGAIIMQKHQTSNTGIYPATLLITGAQPWMSPRICSIFNRISSRSFDRDSIYIHLPQRGEISSTHVHVYVHVYFFWQSWSMNDFELIMHIYYCPFSSFCLKLVQV